MHANRSSRLNLKNPLFIFVCAVLCLAACGENKLQAVKRAGELVVLTRNSATTYYEGPDGPAGFEYDMVQAFADELGVNVHLVYADRYNDIIPMIQENQADMAAAGLAITEAMKKQVLLTPSYQEVRQQVVYRRGAKRPTKIQELIGRQLDVVAGNNHATRLQELKQTHSKLYWNEIEEVGEEELLLSVWQGLLDLTIADSNVIAINRQYYPELLVAFSIDGPKQLAWAFPKDGDDSLFKAAVKFHRKLKKTGELQRLIDRYYGPISRYDVINLTVYQLRIQNRLPLYQLYFETGGEKYNIDWRLLAALGYQESQWDPEAVSPTGVRGMMMLTQQTADHIGVDRLDPEQSIDGGARYIRSRIDSLPKRIKHPDRIWMALAAYNVGMGHLEDARIMTQTQGGDPDKWIDVKERLPLLSKKTWHSKTKHGYARGMEPVIFVDRVRTYYDILTKIDQEEKSRNKTDALDLQAPAI